MKINKMECKSILSESKLYNIKYSINPYTGCQHGCKYCYAVFMKKYTNHEEPWGNFVDVKINAPDKLKDELIKAEEGPILLSSVTDPYQPIEEKYGITQEILKILSKTGFPVSILTKSDLVLRDLDILKKFSPEKISVGFTINFTDDEDRKNWEPATSTIEDKTKALKKLHSERITTYVHVGPWFDGIT
ncbi:MAG: radical SAM protein, partial [Candidatus Aenigmatarchaeota archaeon]